MLGVVGDEVRVDAVGLHPAERGEGAGRVGGGDVGLHEGVVEVGVGLDAAVREDGEELRDLPRVSAPAHGVGEGEEGRGVEGVGAEAVEDGVDVARTDAARRRGGRSDSAAAAASDRGALGPGPVGHGRLYGAARASDKGAAEAASDRGAAEGRGRRGRGGFGPRRGGRAGAGAAEAASDRGAAEA
jgi:hypothetical protein